MCSVVFGAGRLCADDLIDLRRIEITFKSAYFARCGPHDDSEGIEAIGYMVDGGEEPYAGLPIDYVRWSAQQWRERGHCPESGFYVAKSSDWLDTALGYRKHPAMRHFVIDGRDGYVEVLAESFTWREWMWLDGSRDELTDPSKVVASGGGVE